MKLAAVAVPFLFFVPAGCDAPIEAPPPPNALPGVTDVGGQPVINPAVLEYCVQKRFTLPQVREFCKVLPDIDSVEQPLAENILEFVPSVGKGPVPDPVTGKYLAWTTVAEKPLYGYIIAYGITWDDGSPKTFRTEIEFLGDPPWMPGPPRTGRK